MKTLFARLACIAFLGICFCYAVWAEESLTITTYYPSPQGVYKTLKAKRMAVGETYIQDKWVSEGGAISDSADFVVQDRVGIGTKTPLQQLDVAGNAKINNGFVGDVGHGVQWVGFSHYDSASTTGYALLQENSGTYTYLNKKSGGGVIGFRVDNVDKMVINDAGNVGINTNNPQATLHVNGTIRGHLDCYRRAGSYTTSGAQAVCDAGDYVVGGGVEVENPSTSKGIIHVSAPRPGLDGWEGDCMKYDYSSDVNCRAIAVCCRS